MRVIYKKPGEFGQLMEIENELATYNKLVEGYIETFMLTDDIVMIINEEGKLLDLEPNLSIPCHGGYTDVIVGNIVFASVKSPTGEFDGEFYGLKDEDIEFLKKIGIKLNL